MNTNPVLPQDGSQTPYSRYGQKGLFNNRRQNNVDNTVNGPGYNQIKNDANTRWERVSNESPFGLDADNEGGDSEQENASNEMSEESNSTGLE